MWVQIPPAVLNFMAKQNKKHTSEQISGLWSYNNSKECPQCKSKYTKVHESRRIVDGVRRRHVCLTCSNKFTLFEVSSEIYEELKILRSQMANIRDTLGLNVTINKVKTNKSEEFKSDLAIPCCECIHNTTYGCSFDIPEAGTTEANLCSLFKPLISDNMLP